MSRPGHRGQRRCLMRSDGLTGLHAQGADISTTIATIATTTITKLDRKASAFCSGSLCTLIQLVIPIRMLINIGRWGWGLGQFDNRLCIDFIVSLLLPFNFIHLINQWPADHQVRTGTATRTTTTTTNQPIMPRNI